MQDRSHHPRLNPGAETVVGRQRRVSARAALICGAIAMTLSACGAAPPRTVTFATPREEPSHLRFARALRLAARGRVQARAGMDGAASESLRLSYHIVPELSVLTDHAAAAERAQYFGQAHAAWREVLNHPLGPAARKKATAEAERLAPLVPADHVPVLVTVSPFHAAVTLERTEDGQRRVVLSDGVVWLKAGGWQAATVATGYKSELRAFRVERRSNEAFAVVLEPSQKALRMAGSRDGPLPGERVGAKPDGLAPPKEDPSRNDGQAPKSTAKQTPKDPTAGSDVDGGLKQTQPTPPGGGLSKWGPIITAGVGVAALGVGGFFGYNAKQNVDVANGLSPTRPDYKTQLKFYGDAASDRAQLANTMFIAGGALAAVGTVWWLLAPRSGDEAAASSLRPSGMSLSGRGFVALWTF